MRAPTPKVVLISGCSSGIGRAAADRLARRGHIVYATARRGASVDELRQWAAAVGSNARVDQLDVVEAQDGRRVVGRILDECGRIDVLVNNAGFGQAGSVEDIDLERWRRQFEVNLFGTIALTQAVLPAMRAAHSGRVINVSSVVAHVTLPFMGAYAATKHALDAVSKSLRMEVRRWGIRVILVEPGPIATEFRANVRRNADEPAATASAYADAYAVLSAASRGWRELAEAPADRVALDIQRAVESRRPRTRYRITAVARWVPAAAFLLGDRLTDTLALRSVGLR